jgi:hypothetical protein
MTHSTHGKEDRHDENPEQEIAKSLEELDAIDSAMLERIGGDLTEEQVINLGNLLRLDHSLRGPDDTLDQELYSRPFPPHKRIKHQHPVQRKE